MSTKTTPKPKCSQETLELLRQVEAAIQIWEAEGEITHMIKAMIEKNELLKQAVQESSDWARKNTPVIN